MYNINKRAEFKTVGDLKRLLAEVPDETKLYICGACGWFHINEETNVICLDTDDLEECYDYDDDEDECPFGGDITNDCADCVSSVDYHYENGECIRRKDI